MAGKNTQSKNQHVLPHSSGWAVKTAGSSRNTKIFKTQDDAAKFAIKVAKNSRSELFIHSKNGRIRERNTYGVDKFPPKG